MSKKSEAAANQKVSKINPANQVEDFSTNNSNTIFNSDASEAAKSLRLFLSIEPTRFYHKSVDQKGHGKHLYTRVPEHWLPAIGYIIERVKAYKTISDFIRDSVAHRIRQLVELEKELDPNEIALIATEIIAEKSITDGIAYDKALKLAEASLVDAKKRRDSRLMALLIENYENAANQMVPIYRDKFLKNLVRWKKLLRKVVNHGKTI